MLSRHWRDTRALLNETRWELAQFAVSLYPAATRVAGTCLLTDPAWIPGEPVPLDQVTLTWTDDEVDWPVRPDGRYSSTMRILSPPRIFENRTCYGLRKLDATDRTMEFGRASYFDVIDIGEAVAHEFADMVLRQREDLPLRGAVGDPLDLSRRPLPVAISTLVLRVDRAAGQTQMVLHWRDPGKVASGGGLYQVAPVGVFQPSDEAEWNLRNDFDLWRNIQREMSEELLGTGEEYASSTGPIDYGRWDFARALDSARDRGELTASWLGAGIDPLTLVCDLLCCVRIDAPVFDSVFADLVSKNDEGSTVCVPFDEESVHRYSSDEPMQPAGAALLRLALQ